MHADTDPKPPRAPGASRLWIFVPLGLLALLLGMAGFAAGDPPASFLERLYRSIRLFFLDSGESNQAIPLSLEIARWLAPASLLGSVFELLRGHLRRMARMVRARWSRDHVVIVGFGRTGRAFARAYLSARRPPVLVAIDREIEPVDFELHAHPRLIVLEGDARDPAMLRNAAVDRARQVVIVTDDDPLNLELSEVLVAGREQSARTRNRSVLVHLSDMTLRDALQRSDGADGVRLVNHYADLARKVLLLHPLEDVCSRDAARELNADIHLLVTDLDRLQLALVLEAARVGHYLGGRKVHVHIVQYRAAAARDRLLASYPQYPQCVAGLQPVEVPEGASFVRAVASLVRSLPRSAVITVLPSTLDGRDVHADVFRLREQVVGWSVRILLPHLGEVGPGAPAGVLWLQKLHRQQSGVELGGEVCFFDEQAILSACVVDSLDGVDDGLAQKIHEEWFQGQVELAKKLEADAVAADVKGAHDIAAQSRAKAAAIRAKPTFRPWAELTEAQKEQNYAQASHFAIKVRAAGLRVRDLDAAQWAAIDVEPLARMEHERWMAFQWLAGWTQAEVRDDARRRHADLVPYDQLAEEVRKWDRDAVHRVARLAGDLRKQARAEQSQHSNR